MLRGALLCTCFIVCVPALGQSETPASVKWAACVDEKTVSLVESIGQVDYNRERKLLTEAIARVATNQCTRDLPSNRNLRERREAEKAAFDRSKRSAEGLFKLYDLEGL